MSRDHTAFFLGSRRRKIGRWGKRTKNSETGCKSWKRERRRGDSILHFSVPRHSRASLSIFGVFNESSVWCLKYDTRYQYGHRSDLTLEVAGTVRTVLSLNRKLLYLFSLLIWLHIIKYRMFHVSISKFFSYNSWYCFSSVIHISILVRKRSLWWKLFVLSEMLNKLTTLFCIFLASNSEE